MLNQVVLIGRPTKDPEVRYSSGDEAKAIARFNIAVDRFKEGTDFISCVAFGKTAETIEKYVHKGKLICISGRIQTGSYEKDGRKVYTTDVVAEKVVFLDSKKSANDNGTEDIVAETPEGFSKITDEDIPF